MVDPKFNSIVDLFDTLMLREAEVVNKAKEEAKKRIVQGDFDGAAQVLMCWSFVTGVLVGRGDMRVSDETI